MLVGYHWLSGCRGWLEGLIGQFRGRYLWKVGWLVEELFLSSSFFFYFFFVGCFLLDGPAVNNNINHNDVLLLFFVVVIVVVVVVVVVVVFGAISSFEHKTHYMGQK